MILGLNTELRRKGKTFHIQTEDSGLQNPVLITHVFIGGTIIGTRKSDYEEELEREDLEDFVRNKARAQHREAHKAVMAGDYDEAARRPMKKRGNKSIPLARKKGPVGLISPETGPHKTISQPPAEEAAESIEELESVDVMFIEDEEVKELLADSEPPAPSPTSAAVAAAKPEGADPMEWPTELLSRRPLDGVLLAYLLEED